MCLSIFINIISNKILYNVQNKLHKIRMETEHLSQPSAYEILVDHSLYVVFRFVFVT